MVKPSLVKYMPEWLPGAAFKRKGRKVRAFVDRLEKDLYRVTLTQLVRQNYEFYSSSISLTHLWQERGETTSSFVADFLNEHADATADEKDFCREVATYFYGGACPMSQVPHAVLTEASAGADTVRTFDAGARTSLTS